MLYSDNLPKIMERFRREYDIVVIDSPPLLQFADARLLARVTDGVVMVVRAGTTNRSEALRATSLLNEDHVGLLGVILNNWSPGPGEAKIYDQYRAYYQKA